jgi:hypothetical protein
MVDTAEVRQKWAAPSGYRLADPEVGGGIPGVGGSAAGSGRPGAEGSSGRRLYPRPGRVHADQMIPAAAVADFDHVTGDGILPPPIPGQLGPGGHAAAAGREAGAEDEGDVNQLGRLADRALVAAGHAEVLGRSQQFRMGVTDVELGQPALAVLADDRVAGEAVFNLSSGRGCLDTTEPSLSKAHACQGNASPGSRCGHPAILGGSPGGDRGGPRPSGL